MLKVRGDAAQVWQSGVQVGNLYRYTLHGVASDWSVDALKYRLTPAYVSKECEFRFFIESEGKVQMEIRTEGTISGQVNADGLVHRETVVGEGKRLWIPTGEPQSA